MKSQNETYAFVIVLIAIVVVGMQVMYQINEVRYDRIIMGR